MLEKLQTTFQGARDWVNDPKNATIAFAIPGVTLATTNLFLSQPALPGYASMLLAFAAATSWMKATEIKNLTISASKAPDRHP